MIYIFEKKKNNYSSSTCISEQNNSSPPLLHFNFCDKNFFHSWLCRVRKKESINLVDQFPHQEMIFSRHTPKRKTKAEVAFLPFSPFVRQSTRNVLCAAVCLWVRYFCDRPTAVQKRKSNLSRILPVLAAHPSEQTSENNRWFWGRLQTEKKARKK